MPQTIPDSWILSFYLLIGWALTALFAVFRILADERMTWAAGLRIGLLVWLGVPALLAMQGWFWDFSGSPPHLLRVVFPMVSGTAIFCLSPWGKWVAERIPTSLMIGLQGFRFPLELLLYAFATRGLLSREMTLAGYNFDIITGLTAFPVWWLVRKRRAPLWLVWTWNSLGLVLLITVVTIAILGFPEPFGWFSPPNLIVAAFPWIWLPTFLVPCALATHLLVFRQLLLPTPKELNV